jgi:hypothetical protein
MSEEEVIFQHSGHTFKVTNTRPDPSNIKAGDWVRICYPPHDSKSDIVALVLSCNVIWRKYLNLPDDHLLKLARDGDRADVFEQLFSEEYIEIVEKMGPQTDPAHEESSDKGHRSRANIVVCLDGTWNDNEMQDTNVHRILGFLDKDRAIVNYYSGVGVGGIRLQNGLVPRIVRQRAATDRQ